MVRFSICLFSLLIAAVHVSAVESDNPSKDAPSKQVPLSRITIPDDDKQASQTLQKWLTERGFECQVVNNVVVYTHQRILSNLFPITSDGELDRLQVAVFYNAKDEFRGKPEMEALAMRLNKGQNMLRVFIDDEGDLAVTGNINYIDELSAKEFDAYMDLFAAVVKRYILTEEALKLLK